MKKSRRVAISMEIDQPYPHHHDVFLGIQRYAKEHPYWNCLIDEHPGYAMNRRTIDAGYDGVIGRLTKPMQKRLKHEGMPMVNVVYAFHTEGIGGVYLDTTAAGRLAAEHLIDRGFNRLVAVVERTYAQSRLFAQGFMATSEEAGVHCKLVEIDEGKYFNASEWVGFEKSILQVIDGLKPPTGLFITNPSAARLVVQFVQSRGLHVPHDLAVICQHNVLSMVGVPPQITSMDSNLDRVGYEAAALLDRLMEGEAPPNEPILISPKGVIGRETTDYFAVEDELVAEALRYISSHLHTKLRVDDIAYELNVSTRLLQLRFDEALGIAVSDEVRRLRLEKAKRMLADPELLIGSIPKAVGFATADVMNKIFKREVGMTPGGFRKKILHSDGLGQS